MLKAYHFFKLLTAVILGCLLTLAVFYEITSRVNPEYFSSDRSEGVVQAYQGVKGFIFYDPYYQSVLARVNQSVDDFRGNFTGLSEFMDKLSTDKEFLNSLFILQVSKKTDDLQQLLRREAGSNLFFQDFIITDPAKALLFKYGDTPFSADFISAESNQVIRPYEGTLAIIQNYEDAMLETRLFITLIISTNGIQTQLKNFGYSALFLMNNVLYKNSSSFPNVANRLKNSGNSHQKFSAGMSVVEFFPLALHGSVLGVLAVNYPARSLGSTVLMLVKFLLFLLLVGGWILLDRAIEKWLVKAEAWKKTLRQPTGRSQQAQEVNPADTDKSLEWFQHYVEGSEEKKK